MDEKKQSEEFEKKIWDLNDILAVHIEPYANDKDLSMVIVAAAGLMAAFTLSYQGHKIVREKDFDQILSLMHDMFDENFRSGMLAGTKAADLNKALDELIIDHLKEPSKQKH